MFRKALAIAIASAAVSVVLATGMPVALGAAQAPPLRPSAGAPATEPAAPTPAGTTPAGTTPADTTAADTTAADSDGPAVGTTGQRAQTGDRVFAGGLYVDETSDAARAAVSAAADGRTTDAALLRQVGSQPTSVWLGDWLSPAQLVPVLTNHLAAAKASGATPVFVTYAVPNRDCGGHSAGGLSEAEYSAWNRAVADTLQGSGAVVLVEPDSLAQLSSCPQDEIRRTAIIRAAVTTLTGAGIMTYLDAGHSDWVPTDVMAARLSAAGVDLARGFVTNVSNFQRVDDERRYADALSAKLGNAFYLIDVSRNGAGSTGDWCNPSGAALGIDPRVVSDGRGVADGRGVGDGSRLDALLWVKRPGESDGTCNGGPSAGTWSESSALGLARNRR